MTYSFRTWKDYTYPGTDVLRNKFDIRDAGDLRVAEEDAAYIRMAAILTQDPVLGSFDREHMKAIHDRLFGDVYEWAGQERVGPADPMVKGGPTPAHILSGDYFADDGYKYEYFPAGDAMVQHFDEAAELLNREARPGQSAEAFTSAITEPWAEINVAHIFREGNTRTQVVFFTYFARHCGHELNFQRWMDPNFRGKFNAARYFAQATADYELLEEVLREVVDTTGSEPGQHDLLAPSSDYQPLYSLEEYASKYDDPLAP